MVDNDKGDTGFANRTYGRACKSIAACPIPYSNLNELLSLQYVGKVMLAKLMKKQKEYYLARGMEIPTNGGGGLEVSVNGEDGDAVQLARNATSGSRQTGRGGGTAPVSGGDGDEGEGSGSAFNLRLQAGSGGQYRFCS